MKLKRNSLFVKWCYAMDWMWNQDPRPWEWDTGDFERWVPSRTSICALFWRMWLSPLAVAALWLLVALLGIGFVVGIVAGSPFILAWYLTTKFWPKSVRTPTPIRVTTEWLAAKKRRVCPIVYLTDEEDSK